MVTFADRHIGPTDAAQRTMLAALGLDTTAADSALSPVEALMRQAVPASIYTGPSAEATDAPSLIPSAASETEALAELRTLASRNTVNRPMIGLGYYGTITPQVIQRNVLENPSWYTAYTPYQPEISQGRLEALINFQTMVAELTGLTTANASMLDESTAVVEAMLLAPTMRDRAIGWPERLFLRINAVFPALVDGALRKQLAAIKRFAAPAPTHP